MVITNLDQVSTAWLTDVLSRSGALTRGAVTGCDMNAGRGNWSRNCTLHLRYAPDAQGERPARLFLKLVNTDLGDGEFFGPSEVHYYTRDYVNDPDAPLLRCYDAAWSPALQRYHVLLDDVSATHVNASEKEPTLAFGLALAEGLATLHAHWWCGERLAEAGAPMHSADHIQSFVAIAEPGVAHILRRFSHELQPHWPDLMRDLFARHPHAMIERTGDPNGFTLIHGDTGEQNILVPREGQHPLYIIDRQPFDWSLTTWLGVYDLAYAMVLDWPTDLRRQWEMPVLARYHARLVEHGVQGYTWQRLVEDYRLCLPMGVYVAVEYCRGGINERWISAWLTMLQRSLTACDDLDCRALWQGGA